MPSFRGSSQPKDRTQVSCTADRCGTTFNFIWTKISAAFKPKTTTKDQRIMTPVAAHSPPCPDPCKPETSLLCSRKWGITQLMGFGRGQERRRSTKMSDQGGGRAFMTFGRWPRWAPAPQSVKWVTMALPSEAAKGLQWDNAGDGKTEPGTQEPSAYQLHVDEKGQVCRPGCTRLWAPGHAGSQAGCGPQLHPTHAHLSVLRTASTSGMLALREMALSSFSSWLLSSRYLFLKQMCWRW